MENNSKEYTIDLLHIVRACWHRAWIIVLAAVLAAVLGFSVASFMITPQYSSSILVYVNNNAFDLSGSLNITASDLSASQGLVKTYGELLDNRTTLEMVIEEARVNYTYKELSEMIESGSVNGTEIMRITVTTNDPYESSRIANSIAQVLPYRIEAIIEGASMNIVDSAIPNPEKVSPSITKYTAIGLILGALIAIIVLVIMAIMDDTVHDEEYILQNYKYPILAKIPNLTGASASRHSRYGGYYKKNPDANDIHD